MGCIVSILQVFLQRRKRGQSMGKKILIPVLGESATRADELKALAAMKEAAGSRTYLSELFTAGFMGYVETAIKADIFPDIAWDLETAKTALTELRRELNERDALISELYQLLLDREGKVTKLEARLASVRAVLAE